MSNYYPDQTRNLNPTLEARVAMIVYGKAYSEQNGGSMDFWDSLSDTDQKRCQMVIDLVKKRLRHHHRASHDK